jgi:hypothetical protein
VLNRAHEKRHAGGFEGSDVFGFHVRSGFSPSLSTVLVQSCLVICQELDGAAVTQVLFIGQVGGVGYVVADVEGVVVHKGKWYSWFRCESLASACLSSLVSL